MIQDVNLTTKHNVSDNRISPVQDPLGPAMWPADFLPYMPRTWTGNDSLTHTWTGPVVNKTIATIVTS